MGAGTEKARNLTGGRERQQTPDNGLIQELCSDLPPNSSLFAPLLRRRQTSEARAQNQCQEAHVSAVF